MALIDRFPRHIFTSRGWGLLGAGAVFLLAAQVMGRRDLLALAVLLFVLPVLSLAGTRVLKPNFQVYREFNPASVETAATTTVRLAVARTGFGSGHALMEERLPPGSANPRYSGSRRGRPRAGPAGTNTICGPGNAASS